MSFAKITKALILPVSATFDVTRDNTNQKGGAQLGDAIGLIIQMGILIGAGWLAWDCNKGQSKGVQIFMTIIAVIFSGFYLLYYFIYRILMAVPCNIAK